MYEDDEGDIEMEDAEDVEMEDAEAEMEDVEMEDPSKIQGAKAPSKSKNHTPSSRKSIAIEFMPSKGPTISFSDSNSNSNSNCYVDENFIWTRPGTFLNKENFQVENSLEMD